MSLEEAIKYIKKFVKDKGEVLNVLPTKGTIRIDPHIACRNWPNCDIQGCDEEIPKERWPK